MKGYDVVLFLHLAAVAAAFFLSGAIHAAEYQMRAATTVAELRQVIRPLRFAPLFGPIVVALFGLGMALVGMSHKAYDAGDPFAWTAIVVLVVLAIDGPALLGRHAKALETALEAAPDGPVPAAARATSLDPVAWMVGHANSVVVLAVMLNMTAKPSLAWCVTNLVVGVVLGAGIGWLMRQAAARP